MEYFNFDLSCYNEPINAFNANGRVDANNYNNNYNIHNSVYHNLIIFQSDSYL